MTAVVVPQPRVTASVDGAPTPDVRVPTKVVTDGKQFALAQGGQRFHFHGVTYGTFRPRDGDGARFPTRQRMERDLEAMAASGFTVVRTYTVPPEDMIAAATRCGLHVLPEVFYADWRYMLGASRREIRAIARAARAEVRSVVRQLAGNDTVMALSLGNEIPADVVRWLGTSRVAGFIRELADVAREEDPDCLVTYANYPTAEYLPLECLDFLMFNVFLERQADFRRYLTRLHQLAGDRPLVLGEIGLDAGDTASGEDLQAQTIDWQLSTALERGVSGTCVFSWTDEWWVGERAVEGWHFGLTRGDRSPRPALAIAEQWNRATVRDLNAEWLSVSVVICAYNAAGTLDESLRHTCALDYPDLEIIVVDDGSTDETAAIVDRHPRARLIQIEHAGLSVARNEGFAAARGELIAFLDADAYPSPEWPYYLVLGLDDTMVGGVGGPNVPPRMDPAPAQRVAHAPGGPVHVLVSDDRAEHLPGCNMAFWKKLLKEVGGFDPIYTAAGDDVDLCWKVVDRGWELGFHPAALVWHHVRSGMRTYLRQQQGYGRAEALVEARHPNRFNAAGMARWRGRIYNSFAPRLARQRIYRGIYGTASYQSVYGGRSDNLGLIRHIGIPLAVLVLPTVLLALRWPLLAVPAAAALALVLGLFVAGALRVAVPPSIPNRLTFRLGVAVLETLQPLARTWGRIRYRALARECVGPPGRLEGPVRRLHRGVLLLPETQPRDQTAAAVLNMLRRVGLRISPPSGWEDYDASMIGSTLIRGDLITSSHPLGCIQIRVRRRLRLAAALICVALVVAALLEPSAAAVVALVGLVETARGAWRTGPLVRKTIERAAGSSVSASRS